MPDQKIIFFILPVFIYCLYSVGVWLREVDGGESVNVNIPQEVTEIKLEKESPILNETPEKKVVKAITLPSYVRNGCSVLEILTKKPLQKLLTPKEMDSGTNTIAVIGVTVFLVALAIHAIMDVIKVKEEERVRKKQNPDEERRQSLSEFANKKSLRRESSKFGLQLFQIAESIMGTDKDKKSTKQTKPTYTRGDSTNSYLSEKNKSEGQTKYPETPTGEAKLVKRQSVAKLFGARPSPMVRRSSFPALPLNPDVQALMLGHRRPSTDSDDEGDGRGRRVRIIRRY